MLRGWAEICAYTKYSKHTIRRWMKTKGFPVFPGHGVRQPISSESLIDKWLLNVIHNHLERKIKR
jgi:hypothetical protein